MMRTAHDRNYPAQLVSGDSMATEEFGLIAQAVEKARSLALQAVIASREHQFDTVLGRIGFDDKSDITTPSGTWYVWDGGEHVPLA